jgi:hypothetical protein
MTAEIAHLFALLLQRFSFVWQIPLLTEPPSFYPVRTGNSTIRPNIALNLCRFRCPSARIAPFEKGLRKAKKAAST